MPKRRNEGCDLAFLPAGFCQLLELHASTWNFKEKSEGGDLACLLAGFCQTLYNIKTPHNTEGAFLGIPAGAGSTIRLIRFCQTSFNTEIGSTGSYRRPNSNFFSNFN